MKVEKEKRIHSVLSNVFYYTFVSLVIAILIMSLVLDNYDLILNILFISLLVSTVVIVFYLTVQMLRYNISVNKKAQIGIFLIVVGFLLILFSTGKQITLGEDFILNKLGDTFFVYWGIGSIVAGIIVELTFLDQFIWDMIEKPIKFLWKKLVSFVKWFVEHWKNILLYSLDIISLGGIVTIAILWPTEWSTDWWKIVILSVCCVYPIIHHSKRIWRVIKYVAVDIFYTFFHNLFILLKEALKVIWDKIVAFFKFIAEHWWTILKEILRLAGVACGIVFIYYGIKPPQHAYFIWIGIAVIIFSQIFTRKVILQAIWNAFVSLATFIWDKIVSFYAFIVEHWWTILKEILRLAGVACGIVFIYYGIKPPQHAYFIWIGVAVIIFSQIFTRKVILQGIWNAFVSLVTFIWDKIVAFANFVWSIIDAIFLFIIEHWWPILKEILRLVGVAGSIVLIYFGLKPGGSEYLVWLGSIAIIISEVFTRKAVLKKIWEIFSQFFIFIWENIIKPYYKRIINETIRLMFTGAGVYALYFAFINDSEKYSYLFYIGFLTILLAEIIIRKPVLLKLKEIVVNLSLFFWEIILILKDPFVALWNKFVALLKFVKEHWIKVILYTLDFAALVAILYFSFNFEGYWWRILILVASSLYIPCHHYKTVWKVLKFIAIDIFYNPIVRILDAIKAFFVKAWEIIVEIFAFIAEHWRTILKEFIRFVGMIGGFVLIIYGDRREYWYCIMLGVFSIVFFQLLTRKKVMIKFYEFFKALIELLIERRVLIFRILGLAAVITGIAIGFERNWGYEAYLSLSIGGTFLLFSHFIFHPKKLLEFLKKIPEFISKIFVTVWLTLKSVFGYIGDNFLTLLLLSIVIFSIVYGISLLLTIVQPYFDFLGVFPVGFSVPIMMFIGAGLIVMASVAIIILRWRGELKKLKTGRSKKLAEQIEELWKK
ncbi:MAG: hypothetical protein ACTSPF_12395 [Candidatus Heimdallarchaeaceae archaeon]